MMCNHSKRLFQRFLNQNSVKVEAKAIIASEAYLVLACVSTANRFKKRLRVYPWKKLETFVSGDSLVFGKQKNPLYFGRVFPRVFRRDVERNY